MAEKSTVATAHEIGDDRRRRRQVQRNHMYVPKISDGQRVAGSLLTVDRAAEGRPTDNPRPSPPRGGGLIDTT